MKRGALLLLVVVLLLAESPVKRLAILRATGIAPDDELVVAVIQIEPNPENRYFDVTIEYGDEKDDHVQYSRIYLDGDKAYRTFWIRFQHVPGEGQMFWVVRLYGSTGVIAKTQRPIFIQPRWSL